MVPSSESLRREASFHFQHRRQDSHAFRAHPSRELPDSRVAECRSSGGSTVECNRAECGRILNAPREKTDHIDYEMMPWGHEMSIVRPALEWHETIREAVAAPYCERGKRPISLESDWRPVKKSNIYTWGALWPDYQQLRRKKWAE